MSQCAYAKMKKSDNLRKHTPCFSTNFFNYSSTYVDHVAWCSVTRMYFLNFDDPRVQNMLNCPIWYGRVEIIYSTLPLM
jgi:hypothetical protein